MASRSKWEDMSGQLKNMFSISDDNKKPSEAPLGEGMAEKTRNTIKDYNEKQKKEIDNILNGN